MRKIFLIILILLLILSVIPFGMGADGYPPSQPPEAQYENDGEFAPGSIIVKLKNNPQLYSLPDIGIGYTQMRCINPGQTKADNTGFMPMSISGAQNNIYVLTLEQTGRQAVIDALEILGANPDVEYAEPDYYMQLFKTPDDPGFENQYAFERINAQGAWEITTGSKDTVVGIVDSGMDGQHPELAPNLWENPNAGKGRYADDIHGYCFGRQTGGIPTDPASDSHGTHVSGIIGAKGNNGQGIAGMSWDISLAWLGVMADNGTIPASACVEAVNYAVNNEIPILNASWGTEQYVRSLYETLKTYPGLFVAAAGNKGTDNAEVPIYPASYGLPNIISVAATDAGDDLPRFSNFGTNVHIAAPGASIYSTLKNGRFGNKNGTSMAAPYVTGTAALMLAVSPGCTAEELTDMLMKTVRTDDIPGKTRNATISGGIMDAGAAVIYAISTPPSAPAGFDAQVMKESGAVRLTWNEPDDDGYQPVLGYEVSCDGGLTWTGTGYEREHTFTGLENYTWHTFSVRAVNIIGAGEAAAVKARPLDEAGHFVIRLYENVLGRAPMQTQDNDEVSIWALRLINNEFTGSGIAFAFYFGIEFLTKPVTDEEYIINLYATVMDRAPDKEGENHWNVMLRSGMSRDKVLEGFLKSPEFASRCSDAKITVGDTKPQQEEAVRAFVWRLYNLVLGRTADETGLRAWTQRLQSGEQSGAQVARQFFFDPVYGEYQKRNRTGEQYVDDLYAAVMGRSALDDPGRQIQTDRLETGGWSRERLFEDFASSAEFAAICEGYGIVTVQHLALQTHFFAFAT